MNPQQTHARITAILSFWFAPEVIAKNRWFKSDPAFDAKMREDFGADTEKAASGDYDAWAETPDGALALLLTLDQFPRNLYRGTPRAFATDGKAQGIAADAVARGFDQQTIPERRVFFYLPFEHAESVELQEKCVALCAALGRLGFAEYARYAERHAEIIRQFGRFPHRNAILGRTNTPEESAYLAEHPNEFG